MNLALSGNGKEATWAVSLGNWCDLETSPYWFIIFIFPAVFGAHLGLGEYWKSYWLIQIIKSL